MSAALFGMLGVSAIALSLVFWQAEALFVADPAGWRPLLLTGIGPMVATRLLYWALAGGPVGIVAHPWQTPRRAPGQSEMRQRRCMRRDS